jgi:hypothetical protein
MVVLLLFVLKTNAQHPFTENTSIFVGYQQGLLLPEYRFIGTYSEDYTRTLELGYTKKTNGSKAWHKLYKYPEYGFSVLGSTLGNKDVFGKEVAGTVFFKLNLVSYKNIALYHKMGIGLSYVSKIYHPENNYLNVAIGSHLNIHYNARFGLQYQLNNKLNLHAGLAINHLSNANSSEPNLGLNYGSIYGGLSYYIGEKSILENSETPELNKKSQVLIYGSIGGKHPRALPKYYYLTASTSVEWSKKISHKFSFGAGVDIFYDSSINHEFERKNNFFKPQNAFQSGVHIGFSLDINRVNFAIQQGVFAVLPDKLDNYKIYNRGIIQYRVNENLYMRISMKSYLVILDYPELGLAYRIK